MCHISFSSFPPSGHRWRRGWFDSWCSWLRGKLRKCRLVHSPGRAKLDRSAVPLPVFVDQWRAVLVNWLLWVVWLFAHCSQYLTGSKCSKPSRIDASVLHGIHFERCGVAQVWSKWGSCCMGRSRPFPWPGQSSLIAPPSSATVKDCQSQWDQHQKYPRMARNLSFPSFS